MLTIQGYPPEATETASPPYGLAVRPIMAAAALDYIGHSGMECDCCGGAVDERTDGTRSPRYMARIVDEPAELAFLVCARCRP